MFEFVIIVCFAGYPECEPANLADLGKFDSVEECRMAAPTLRNFVASAVIQNTPPGTVFTMVEYCQRHEPDTMEDVPIG